MLNVNILDDEQLSEVLDKFISSLIPHENYDSSFYSDTLSSVFKYIKLEEMSMEYYALFSIFHEINKIRISVREYVPTVDKNIVETILTNNVNNLLQKSNVRVVEWLTTQGFPDKLEIETTFELARQKLYNRTVDLYDKCFELKQSTASVLSYVPALEAAFIGHIAEIGIQTQATIINRGLRIGKKVFKGPTDWLKYCGILQTEITERLGDVGQNILRIDSLEATKTILEGLDDLFTPIGKYGIPQFDDFTPMLRHRLVSIVANENTGKTAVAINLTGELLCNKRKVVFMCGESDKRLNYAKILSNYIFRNTGKYITEQHICNRLECPEDKVQLINIWSLNLQTSGCLILCDSFNYDTLYRELVDLYDSDKIDAVFIDHSLTLTGGYKDDEYTKVGKLAVACREFKKKYPVYVCVLSQLSTLAKELILKGKSVTTAPTRSNGSLSQESDDLFILLDNEVLSKQKLLGIQNYKRRNANKVEDLIYIKKKFSVSAYEYNDKYQSGATGINLNAEVALQNIASSYEQDDGDGISPGDFDGDMDNGEVYLD